MPAALQDGDVLVNGKALEVTLTGHAATIAVPKTTGLTCEVIGPGTVSIVFTRAAGLGNPTTPGTYRVSLRVGGNVAVAPVVVG
jgi:hypothetical protein